MLIFNKPERFALIQTVFKITIWHRYDYRSQVKLDVSTKQMFSWNFKTIQPVVSGLISKRLLHWFQNNRWTLYCYTCSVISNKAVKNNRSYLVSKKTNFKILCPLENQNGVCR